MWPVETILHQTSGSIDSQVSELVVYQFKGLFPIFRWDCKLIGYVIMVFQLDPTVYQVVQDYHVLSALSIGTNLTFILRTDFVCIELTPFY